MKVSRLKNKVLFIESSLPRSIVEIRDTRLVYFIIYFYIISENKAVKVDIWKEYLWEFVHTINHTIKRWCIGDTENSSRPRKESPKNWQHKWSENFKPLTLPGFHSFYSKLLNNIWDILLKKWQHQWENTFCYHYPNHAGKWLI